MLTGSSILQDDDYGKNILKPAQTTKLTRQKLELTALIPSFLIPDMI